jgi:hypothetical protein
MRICDFFADLVRANKSYLEIKEMVKSVYREKALKKLAIYAITKKVKTEKTPDDQRHLNGKKVVRTPALITSVAVAGEEDCWLSIKALATVHGTSFSTMRAFSS